MRFHLNLARIQDHRLSHSYLRRRHHADGCDVPVGHREENHDDDVGGVGLQDDGELGAVLRAHVAHQEERYEGEPEQGASQDDRRAGLRKKSLD